MIASQLGALDRSTNLVTITVGGNDAGFPGVLTTCSAGTSSACQAAITKANSFITTQLPALLAPPTAPSLPGRVTPWWK